MSRSAPVLVGGLLLFLVVGVFVAPRLPIPQMEKAEPPGVRFGESRRSPVRWRRHPIGNPAAWGVPVRIAAAGTASPEGARDGIHRPFDWVELHNHGSRPATLQNLNLACEGRWTTPLPAETLPAGERIRLWLAGFEDLRYRDRLRVENWAERAHWRPERVDVLYPVPGQIRSFMAGANTPVWQSQAAHPDPENLPRRSGLRVELEGPGPVRLGVRARAVEGGALHVRSKAGTGRIELPADVLFRWQTVDFPGPDAPFLAGEQCGPVFLVCASGAVEVLNVARVDAGEVADIDHYLPVDLRSQKENQLVLRSSRGVIDEAFLPPAEDRAAAVYDFSLAGGGRAVPAPGRDALAVRILSSNAVELSASGPLEISWQLPHRDEAGWQAAPPGGALERPMPATLQIRSKGRAPESFALWPPGSDPPLPVLSLAAAESEFFGYGSFTHARHRRGPAQEIAGFAAAPRPGEPAAGRWCGIQIMGNSVRNSSAKLGFQLKFRSEMDRADPPALIPGMEGMGSVSLKTRNLLNNLHAYRLLEACGLLVPNRTPACVFLNGESLGVYLVLEDFGNLQNAERRFGHRDFDLYKTTGFNPYKAGDPNAFNLNWLVALRAGPQTFEVMKGFVDMDRFAEWVAAMHFIGLWDTQFFLLHDGAADRWDLAPWDLDHAFMLADAQAKDYGYTLKVMRHLAHHPTFRDDIYPAAYRRVLERLPDEATLLAWLDEDFSRLLPAMPHEDAGQARFKSSFYHKGGKAADLLRHEHFGIATFMKGRKARLEERFRPAATP